MPYRYRKEHLDRICEFLLESSGVAFCDECLRTALEVTRIIVPERNLAEMAAARGFVRGAGHVCVLRCNTRDYHGDCPQTLKTRYEKARRTRACGAQLEGIGGPFAPSVF